MRLRVLFISLLALATTVFAQGLEARPSLSRCHAIVGATVLVEPGVRLEEATVVVRDGLLEAVGKVEVPPDAEVIVGLGLTISAGFLLVGPAIGEEPERPKAAASEAPDLAAAPSDWARMGVAPHVSATDILGSVTLDVKPWLSQGVTTLVVSPKGRLAMGTSAVVSMGPGTGMETLLRDSATMVVAFRGARGSYPGSVMGIMATLRQMFHDARRLATWERLYSENPAGLEAPSFVPELRALKPVLAGEMPTQFRVQRDGDVRRALSLVSEFRLRPWLRGGAPLGKAAEKIGSSGALAVVDLKLRAPKHETNKKRLKDGPAGKGPAESEVVREETPQANKEDEEEREGADKKDTATKETEAKAPELDPYALERGRKLAEKEWEDLAPHAEASRRLAEAGAALVFGAEDAKNVLDHVRTQVRFGLGADRCLRALTVEPARHLGLERFLGKVARDYRADLAVFKGDPFSDGQLVHVFARGERYDVPEKKKGKEGAKDGGGAEALAGRWSVTVEGSEDATSLVITSKEGVVSGSFTSRMGDVDVTSATLEGKDATIVCVRDTEQGSFEITVTGTLEGNTLSGTIAFGSFAERAFTASREPRRNP